MYKIIAQIIFLFILSSGYALANPEPLPVDQAFQLNGVIYQNEVKFHWKIAPGYYLYRSQLQFKPTFKNTAAIGVALLPQGEIKKDLLHGVFQSYTHDLVISIPLKNKQGQLSLQVQYQGCSSKGFCYPPMKKTFEVNLAAISIPYNLTGHLLNSKIAHHTFSTMDQSYSAQLLAGHNLFLIIIAFLFLGLLLAFTPCVLPMVPILSSIIAGQGNDISTRKAFFLSLSYVLGMALTYAAAGVVIALVGSSIQAALEKPIIITAFSGLFVLLALSLFGLFEIRLPNGLHQRMVKHSNRLKGGALISVFFMGALATLIVSPCVSAPLVGVLAYIGESGDVILGALALLSLGIGMGIPLLLVGLFEGKFLPKAGIWMDKVKQFFGFLMLGLAIWMMQRIVSPMLTLSLYGILAIGLAIFIWRISHTKKIWHHINKTLGLGLLSYGLILVIGAMLGNSDPLAPLQIFSQHYAEQNVKQPFSVITSMQQLNKELAWAKANNKQVILDFYADWCTSCVVMDKRVFNQEEVLSALKDFVVLRADVTQNNAFDKALLARFHVIAPPTMVFFNAKGDVLPQSQIVGEINAKDLLSDLARLQVNEKLKECEGHTRTC